MCNQLKVREVWVEELEAGVVSVRNQLEQKEVQLKKNNTTKALDNILKRQISPMNRSDVGF